MCAVVVVVGLLVLEWLLCCCLVVLFGVWPVLLDMFEQEEVRQFHQRAGQYTCHLRTEKGHLLPNKGYYRTFDRKTFDGNQVNSESRQRICVCSVEEEAWELSFRFWITGRLYMTFEWISTGHFSWITRYRVEAHSGVVESRWSNNTRPHRYSHPLASTLCWCLLCVGIKQPLGDVELFDSWPSTTHGITMR